MSEKVNNYLESVFAGDAPEVPRKAEAGAGVVEQKTHNKWWDGVSEAIAPKGPSVIEKAVPLR